MKISIVGPPKAGKTTFVRYLETRETVEKSPHSTLGVDIRSNYIQVADQSIKVIDTGGEEVYQQSFWEMAILMSDAVIFVFDATMHTDPSYFDLALQQFSYALDIIPDTHPLLIAINKQDLQDLSPISTQEMKELFKKFNTEGLKIKFMETSAKFGTGVINAISWLSEIKAKIN